MTEQKDRILDLSLEEEFGGAQPPDLSDQIRWRLAQNRHRQNQIELLRKPSRRWKATWAGSFFGAAAALAVILLAVSLWSPQSRPSLSFTVAKGSLRWQSADVVTEFHSSGMLFPGAVLPDAVLLDALSPKAHTIFPVLGDRLDASTEDLTVLKLADLGILNMSPGCALEVEQMKVSDFGKGFVVGAVVVAVVAGTAQFLSGDNSVQAEVGERLTLEPGGDQASMGDSVSVGEMQQELTDLRAENQRLIESAARRRAEIPADEVAAAEDDLEISAVITYADFSETLDQMDWAEMGLAAKDMVPKLHALIQALQDGEDPPIGLAGEIQQLNGKILQNLGSLQDGQIPGTGINGAFTHPVFAANLMNATLEAAGVSLDEGQLRSLQDLTGRFAGEDDSRRGSYGDDVAAIQQVVEEIDLRNRFYEQAKANMTPEQLAAIGNGPDGPGPMDLFSGDPAWQQFTKPIGVNSRADLANKLTRNYVDGFGFDSTKDAAQVAKLTQVIDQWAQAAPKSYLGGPVSPLAEAKMFPSSGVSAAAHYQMQLYQNILSQVDLSPSQRQSLLKRRSVFVPVYTGK